MTGSQMRELRRRLGMDRLQMARVIGYTGTDRNDELRVKRLENAGDPVPLYIARLLWLIESNWLMFGSLPTFPQWSGYDFDHSPDPGHKEDVDG